RRRVGRGREQDRGRGSRARRRGGRDRARRAGGREDPDRGRSTELRRRASARAARGGALARLRRASVTPRRQPVGGADGAALTQSRGRDERDAAAAWARGRTV